MSAVEMNTAAVRQARETMTQILRANKIVWRSARGEGVPLADVTDDIRNLAQCFQMVLYAYEDSKLPVEGDALVGALPVYQGFQSHLNHLGQVLDSDRDFIIPTDTAYNSSWKQRGGVGAFFTFARKWDRLEQRVKATGWDVFQAIANDTRREGAIDDLRDLRRYLALAECEAIDLHIVTVTTGSKETPR